MLQPPPHFGAGHSRAHAAHAGDDEDEEYGNNHSAQHRRKDG